MDTTKTDEGRQVAAFFDRILHGELIKREEDIDVLLEQIRQAMAEPHPIAKRVNSLLYRLAQAVEIGYANELGERNNSHVRPNWQDHPPYLTAANLILAFGTTPRPTDNDDLRKEYTADKLIEATRSLVINIFLGKMFTSDFSFYFYFGHPLIQPLVHWLSFKQNQSGNPSEKKRITSFLMRLGGSLFPGHELLQEESFRADLAAALVCNLHDRISQLNMGEDLTWKHPLLALNLIEATPLLVSIICDNKAPSFQAFFIQPPAGATVDDALFQFSYLQAMLLPFSHLRSSANYGPSGWQLKMPPRPQANNQQGR